ncbi:hypothetical protein GCM10020229_80960 [Kitasatospora albolonga]
MTTRAGEGAVRPQPDSKAVGASSDWRGRGGGGGADCSRSGECKGVGVVPGERDMAPTLASLTADEAKRECLPTEWRSDWKSRYSSYFPDLHSLAGGRVAALSLNS